MIDSSTRRQVFGRFGGALGVLAASAMLSPSHSAAAADVTGGGTLAELTRRLKLTPRRRGFRTVPFMLTQPEDWDERAARLLLGYGNASKQVWENTELAAAWPVLMREAMSGEVFAHRHPDFLQVAAMHGLAHLALFTDEAWTRYQLGQLAGAQFPSNAFIREKSGVGPGDDLQDVEGFYGPKNNNIVSLQRRGAVFVACHDSVFTIAGRLHAAAVAGSELASLSTGEIAADLTNSLIPDCVLVPSVVAFLVELQAAGFTYAKGS